MIIRVKPSICDRISQFLLTEYSVQPLEDDKVYDFGSASRVLCPSWKEVVESERSCLESSDGLARQGWSEQAYLEATPESLAMWIIYSLWLLESQVPESFVTLTLCL